MKSWLAVELRSAHLQRPARFLWVTVEDRRTIGLRVSSSKGCAVIRWFPFVHWLASSRGCLVSLGALLELGFQHIVGALIEVGFINGDGSLGSCGCLDFQDALTLFGFLLGSDALSHSGLHRVGDALSARSSFMVVSRISNHYKIRGGFSISARYYPLVCFPKSARRFLPGY